MASGIGIQVIKPFVAPISSESILQSCAHLAQLEPYSEAIMLPVAPPVGFDGTSFPYLPVTMTSVRLDMYTTLGSAAKDCRSALVPMAVDPIIYGPICAWINRVSASVAVLQPPKIVPHPLCGCVDERHTGPGGSLPIKRYELLS
jgi:hypothetical protein